MRWASPALVLSLVLAGCATTPPVSQQPLGADQQSSLLQGLANFSFTGRAVVAGQDPIPSLKWRQRRNVSKVSLNGPFGVGSVEIEYSSERLRLVTGRGVKLVDVEAEQEMAASLGFVPPFEPLRYWILGVPAPGIAVDKATRDADGLLLQLQQQDWQISYERRVAVNTAAGRLQLPAKLVATQGELRLTLVIDRWLMD